MKLFLIVLFFSLIIINNVNAIPFFVSISTNDEDNVYGVNDNQINITARLNSNNFNVSVNFSIIETGTNGSQRVINNNDGSYTINYTILNPVDSNVFNLSVFAFDTNDNTTTVNNSFVVIIDNSSPVISNQNKFPFIAFNTDDLVLNATITDNFGIKAVFITGNWNGSFVNYTSITNISNIFSHIVGSSFLENGEILRWKYVGVDKANNTGEGILIIQRLNNRTNVSISPSLPNGNNGWYITEPIITLLSDLNSSTTFFRFNSFNLQSYTVPFNRSNLLGGIQQIFYFTNFTNNVSNRTEKLQNFTLYVDTEKPVITNILPLNNSATMNSTILFGVLNELSVGTSGINLSTAKMFLDGNLVSANVQMVNNLDANISFNANSLSNGFHNITVSVLDIAGNNGSLTWFFSIDSSNISTINVTSPENRVYDKSRIETNIILNETASKLILFDNFDNKSRLLCNNCRNFSKSLSFREGQHKVSFIASDNASNNISKDVVFSVDLKRPRILRLNYKNKTSSNLSFFDVNYNENFLDSLKFYYRENTSSVFSFSVLNNCKNGTNVHCNLSISSSGLDGKTIIYYFNVSDKVNSSLSKKQEIRFDFSNPALTILDPDNTIYNIKSIRFDIISNEKLKLLSYTDNNGKKIPLCSNCLFYNKTINFKNGTHNIDFKAVDLVGNLNIFSRSFIVL